MCFGRIHSQAKIPSDEVCGVPENIFTCGWDRRLWHMY